MRTSDSVYAPLYNYAVRFPSKWVSGHDFDTALWRSGYRSHTNLNTIALIMSSGCKLLTDAATRLLSLVNDLCHRSCQVSLCFEGGEVGLMSYLNRIGFFDALDARVLCSPTRPKISGAATFGGSNSNLVEFRRICPLARDQSAPSELADAIELACRNRADRKALGIAAFTLFGELIDNIYEHSETPIDGYAALQVYHGGSTANATVAVSDSGRGLLDTLRPTLGGSKLQLLSDSELVVEMFEQGVSRLREQHPQRGAGLAQCAHHALKFKSSLSLRLPNSSLHLMPHAHPERGYAATVLCHEQLPFVSGTHFSFRLNLEL